MNRRSFLKTSAAVGLGLSFFPGLGNPFARPSKKKVLALGIDGLDPHLTQVYMAKGHLPNIRKMIQTGTLARLATSTPPQSPVAWSSIAVGAPARVHGIYDFIHRDPGQMLPFLSTSKVTPSSRVMHIGDWAIPLSSGSTELLRKGKPFWDYLSGRDIPVTLFKMPANFPCEQGNIEMVTGMGTPDIRGGYGSFTLLTSNPLRYPEDIGGGIVIPIRLKNNRATCMLPGPENSLRSDHAVSAVPVEIWRDRRNPVVRIKIQNNEFILNQGDWTDWFTVSFPLMGSMIHTSGICKIYVKQIFPELAVYLSPINIDPSDTDLPVVSSKKYARMLTDNNGLFYTQGFPEDTKALSEGVLTEDEYLDLAAQVFDERNRLFRFELERFKKRDEGLLFFYFSSLDQNSHMYFRTIDRNHPLYTPEDNDRYGHTLLDYYMRLDRAVGRVAADFDFSDPDFSIMLFSDHGFAPFRRQVNLNSWLLDNGHIRTFKGKPAQPDGYFTHVDWSKTAAYNLGINSIYLNINGREKEGTVDETRAGQLKKAIQKDLLAMIDPVSGTRTVTRVDIVSDAERAANPHAPDLIVGWNTGYRTSWDSILGGFSPDIVSDNLDKWSGDHCIAPEFVPATFISNKRIVTPAPSIYDIAPTILGEFGITPDKKEMPGSFLFG